MSEPKKIKVKGDFKISIGNKTIESNEAELFILKRGKRRIRLKRLKKRIPEVAYYLELLKQKAFFKTQRAVEEKNEGLLRDACNEVGVPKEYIPTIIRILLKERMFSV